MAWTYTQQVVLALIPKVTAVLSCFGSSWIMVEVLTDNTDLHKPKRKHPYHRLLFAMSLYDVLEGIFNFMSTWMIPKGTEGVAWALGNTATCSTQGFFLTLSVAVPIYNAMLSIYYVLVINYRVKDETLRKWVEPCMHLTAGSWAFFTATYSATTGLINNANLWCWIAPLVRCSFFMSYIICRRFCCCCCCCSLAVHCYDLCSLFCHEQSRELTTT